MMDIWILVALILGSGILAMAEMAVGASRDSQLEMRAERGETGAMTVLSFRQQPSRFLATVQLGITVMAMLSGAFGESLWVPRVEGWIAEGIPALKDVAYGISLAFVVSLITFFSLVFGEVIPKRLAMANPESIAIAMSGLTFFLLKLVKPLVWVVSKSADWILGFMPFKGSAEATASDEIRFLVQAGRKTGTLDSTEAEILGNVFRLDNRRVGAIMTPAASLVTIDLARPWEENMAVLQGRPMSRYLVCKNGLSNLLGFVEGRELLREMLNGNKLDFGKLSPKAPHFAPSTLSLIGLLEFFKANQTQIALVVNEFGATEGLVTLSDLMGTVVGDVMSGNPEAALALQRTDGSWLLDGLLPIDEFKELLSLPALPAEELGNYHTVGGFVISQLGRIPRKTEGFQWGSWYFEVMDMEKNRVDEVLAKRIEQ